MTKRVGLIGYPLKHSISPLFQQAALAHEGLDIQYEAWEVEPGRLPSVIEQVRQPSTLGMNVTVPYKETMLELVDELDELASRLGAVNTVVNRDGRLTGHNTDAAAFLRALRQEGGFEPAGKSAVLLGAGGVARAASFMLVRAGVRSLAIVDIIPERAEALTSHLKPSGSNIVALSWGDQRLSEALSECNLLVNCTPLGMKHSSMEGKSPLEAELIPGKALVYDVVYNPVETPLLLGAKQAGARTLGGLPMLVYQGAASFELWTGIRPPIDIMFKAARGAL